MNKPFLFIILSICLLITSCTGRQGLNLKHTSPDRIAASMKLDEKIHLLIGTDMEGFQEDSVMIDAARPEVPGAAGATYAIPRFGIPSIVMAEGTSGLRISPTREGDDQTYYCTTFPIPTLLASTWNTELMAKVGEDIGNEALEYGVDVLLAPALNIQRNPLGGRNFEYYSEDPVVSGQIAAAMVKGIQSNGVAASLKYFAANNQVTSRMGSDSRLSPRALREIYLKGFEIAIKEADPWIVITSDNYINGVQTSESTGLLRTVLRNEWRFGGMVMSDWFGGKKVFEQVRAGNDLLMPVYPEQYNDILAAVNNGTLKRTDINRNVTNILNLIAKTPRLKGYSYSNKPDLDAHARTSRKSATEGMVLLKNNNQTLPLASGIKTIAAYGISSYDFITDAGIGKRNKQSILLTESLANAGYTLDANLRGMYQKYIHDTNTIYPPALFMSDGRLHEFVPDARSIATQARTADVALITIGRPAVKFADRRLSGDFELTDKERRLLQSVCSAYQSAGKKVIVVLNIGGVIETASWKNLPDAILLAWLPGQEGANSVVDILSGKANPSGKLTMTFPLKYMDLPSSANFPWDIPADETDGPVTTPDNDKPIRNIDYTVYAEDIYVGYRYFDSFRKDVSYPFGFGLSYTSFTYENPEIRDENDDFIVTVDVTNTGSHPGKEVVQLYMSAPISIALSKPLKELKAFAKTDELKPGEKQTITLKVKRTDMASYNEDESSWVVDPGNYKFLLGSSSQDIRLFVNAEISESIVTPATNVLLPREPISVLSP